MCYNCGCQMPDDDMGKGDVAGGGGALVNKTFDKLAQDWGMKPEQAKRNTYELLKKQFGNK